MKGTVDIADFMAHLKANNLVIAPSSSIEVDRTVLQKKVLRLTMVSYKQISDSGIWGEITKDRVAQLAKEHARANEILKITDPRTSGAITKVTRSAIVRIAKMRGYNTVEL